MIFDLDQTLLDTSSVAHLRDAKNWAKIYELIPQLTAFEGIDTIMEFLYENDISIVIVTTSPPPYCSKIVKHCGWKITGQITYYDVNRRKPDPEAFLKAVKDYDLDIKKTISAGDRDIDIKASHAADIPSIACTWASPDKNLLISTNPTYTANSVNELFELIRLFFLN